MTDEGLRIFDLLQLLVAVSAVLIAPEALLRLIDRAKRKLTADCNPRVRARKAEGKIEISGRVIWGLFWNGVTVEPRKSRARIWEIELQNRTSKFRDIVVSIFPSSQGNKIRFAAIRTANDGGLRVSNIIEDGGCLLLSCERFFKSRILEIAIVMSEPDVPEFHSQIGIVSRTISYEHDDRESSKTSSLEVTYHRIVLIMLQFLFFFSIICAKIIYSYFVIYG